MNHPIVSNPDVLPFRKNATGGRRVAGVVRAWLWLIVVGAVMAAGDVRAAESRGGRVSWGRIIAGGDWNIHSDRDPDLAKFIRNETTLNLNPTWHSADPRDLEQLSQFPFLYAKELAVSRTNTQAENLREYLQRGGFLCIDPCIAHVSVSAFFRTTSASLQRIMPGGQLRQLPPSHPIYHCYFHVKPDEIFTRDMGIMPPREFEGLYGWFYDDRLVAVISLYGLECGWPQTPMRTPGCMKMIVNMYVYAMTRGIEPR